MTTKRKYGFLIAATALLAIAGGSIHARKDDFGLGRNMEITVNMMRELALGYVDPIDPDRLMEGAAAGMVSDLDPYTEYISEEGLSDFELLTTGKYGGVGALIRKKGDWVKISQPYAGTPSDRAGLKIGDLILSIDGKSAKGLTTEEVSGMLKGEPGSKVKITVMHLDSTQQSVTLRRERISIPGVPYAGWVKEGIGYIRHSDFTEGCYEEMRAAIDRLRAEGELKGLVLDYRSNGGGIMQEAVKILSLFVPRGTVVVTTRGRNEQRDYRTEAEPILPDLPLAVLVDGSTASSSEIVAGALQDLDRAALIGQRSFGKGLVQATRPLGYNTMLKLTTAKYYIPSGRCIQAIDYSHSQEGSVRTVPDSLISEFETRAGRKVYDGGGIMPDIDVEPEYISRFAATLYALGFIEDFGDEYTRRNPGQQIDIRTFSITDADYADFAAFMQDKEVPYESDTRRALKALKKAAEDDRFAELKEQFERVESELKDDTATNLETYREQVIEAINNDIILRHAYTAGVIEHAMADDKGCWPIQSRMGIDVMSINLLVENEEDPVVWRGPVIAGAVKQFWTDVVWKDVDFLFVDMPPGTGDVPLTVFQSLPVDGIVVVASPQELVSMIVAKAVNMAEMMKVPMLGIVENMSYIVCPDCGKHINVFGDSHVDEVAAKHHLPVLAKCPIDPQLAALSDAGMIETYGGQFLEGAADACEKLLK